MHLLIALLYLLSEGLADIHILHSHRPRVQLAYSLRIPITYALRIPLTYQGPARTNKVEPLLEASGQYLNIIYIDVPVEDESPIDLAQAMQQALGFNPDPLIDSDKRN